MTEKFPHLGAGAEAVSVSAISLGRVAPPARRTDDASDHCVARTVELVF
jgi:hypothetical protein